MSSNELNKVENEEENKSLDKKQIEAEEKELMIRNETENIELATDQKINEGPVKTALSTEFTEQGREVKPKFIPIGGIKMPGFFTRNSDKPKDEDVDRSADPEKGEGRRHHRLQFLHSCPFTQFLHRQPTPETPAEQTSDTPAENGTSATPAAENKKFIRLPNMPKIPPMPKLLRIPNFFQSNGTKDNEAALASLETLDEKEKQDAANDGMENVKLDADEVEGKVETKLPLVERIRQKKFIFDDVLAAVVALLVLISVIAGIVIGAASGPPAERPLRLGKYMVTLTSCGPVEGIRNQSVYQFYNIPYAAPPVGERRFTYAQPLNNISLCWNGTLEAHKPGPACIQFLENGKIIGEEDCLTLDVITPHVRYDSPLPVVVLIGANTLAGGISPLKPSPMYARTKEVVFVRPNFRLGPFGFLALDILSDTKYPPTSGNYALSDLLAVLDWVHHNIKHFGGDPSSVTLFGHRAGATLTAALTTVKKAQRLYSRVWLSSPSVIFPGDPLEQSQIENEKFKTISNCTTAKCLRSISATEIVTVTPDVWLGNNVGTLPVAGEPRHSWLVLDGELLRTHAYETWDAQMKAKQSSGKEKEFKPMVFGTTQHSGHSEVLKMKHLNWTAEIVERIVNDSVIGQKNLTRELFKTFNKTYDGLVQIITVIRTVCPLMTLSRMRLNVPLYLVVADGAGGGLNGTGLAPIDADVEAILGTFDSDRVEQRRFMAAMQQMFYYYVWHGRVPAADAGIVAVGQDVLPIDLPTCELLIREDIVPRYAHID